jgi:DNA-binding LacI/PurR family transcriptional regulator
MRRVEVIVATGCHLCPPAIEAATAACAGRGVELTIVDIDGDVDLERRYRELIPVVLVDGVEVSHFVVDQLTIEKALLSGRS